MSKTVVSDINEFICSVVYTCYVYVYKRYIFVSLWQLEYTGVWTGYGDAQGDMQSWTQEIDEVDADSNGQWSGGGRRPVLAATPRAHLEYFILFRHNIHRGAEIPVVGAK